MKLSVLTEVDLPDSLGSFQEAELKIKEAVLRSGLELMELLFVGKEEQFLGRKGLWMKDRRVKRYQTLLGELSFSRLRLWNPVHQVSSYPLDEWLGLKSKEKVTCGLKQAIVQAAIDRSYRQASSEISRWTGIDREDILGKL